MPWCCQQTLLSALLFNFIARQKLILTMFFSCAIKIHCKDCCMMANNTKSKVVHSMFDHWTGCPALETIARFLTPINVNTNTFFQLTALLVKSSWPSLCSCMSEYRHEVILFGLWFRFKVGQHLNCKVHLWRVLLFNPNAQMNHAPIRKGLFCDTLHWEQRCHS